MPRIKNYSLVISPFFRLALYVLSWAAVNGVLAVAAVKVFGAGSLAGTLCAMLSTNVVVIALFAALRWWREDTPTVRRIPWQMYPLAPALAASCIVPLLWLNEAVRDITGWQLDISDEMQRLLTSLLDTPWGFVAVAVATPVMEEVVFRGAILRTLLQSCRRPWLCVLLSALIFGIAHGNAVQFLNATLMGCLLGYLYYITRSVLPCALFHITNNTLCFFGADADDMRLIDLFHGSYPALCSALFLSLAVLASALFYVRRLSLAR